MKEDEMVGYHLGSSENIKQDKQKKKNLNFILGFPGGSDGTESTCLAGHQGSIPGLGRFPGVGHGSPLQYSCLENPMDQGAWWATIHGVTKNRTQLSDFTSLT